MMALIWSDLTDLLTPIQADTQISSQSREGMQEDKLQYIAASKPKVESLMVVSNNED